MEDDKRGMEKSGREEASGEEEGEEANNKERGQLEHEEREVIRVFFCFLTSSKPYLRIPMYVHR